MRMRIVEFQTRGGGISPSHSGWRTGTFVAANTYPEVAEGERFIEVPGGRVWVNVVGSGSGAPLLLLHGGPGGGHDYLEPLGTLGDDRPVIFYDQLGCGLSDRLDNPALWTMERFVEELAVVRQTLGLSRFHLYGHSWGGWLAIEYLLHHPREVAGTVLASTSASIAEFVAGTQQLRSLLPKDVQGTLDDFEAREEYTAPAYEAAVGVFYDNFLYRQQPYAESLLRSLANLDGNQVYATMNGPNEFVVTGNLVGWDRTSRLGEIATPALLTRGKYDEFEVRCADTLERGLPNVERVEFADSAHFAMLEEEDAYVAAMRSFLRRND
jgi:proline iminopeptidase